MRPVYVLGVGAHAWGKFPESTQLTMALEALDHALGDARVGWSDVECLVAASSRFEGGLGWGLHANEVLQSVAEGGAAAINVGGGCAAGGIAVHTAAAMVASGQHEVVVALGAERMPTGFIPRPPGSADDPSDLDYLRWVTMGATNPAYWALEARRRMHEVGTTPDTLARASVLMHDNAAANPRARYRKPCTVEQVLSSPVVSDPLHLLEICAVSDGAAAVVLGTEEQARRLGGTRIELAGTGVSSGRFGDPAARIPTVAMNPLAGTEHTSEVTGAVRLALGRAGLTHADVDFIEIADNTAWHVLAWPEMLGFFEQGEADTMLLQGEMGIRGRLPVNPSGGFLSFGEATTAQGVLQVCELVWQLRGEVSPERQVPDARVGLAAVLGLGANGAATVLRRG